MILPVVIVCRSFYFHFPLDPFTLWIGRPIKFILYSIKNSKFPMISDLFLHLNYGGMPINLEGWHLSQRNCKTFRGTHKNPNKFNVIYNLNSPDSRPHCYHFPAPTISSFACQSPDSYRTFMLMFIIPNVLLSDCEHGMLMCEPLPALNLSIIRRSSSSSSRGSSRIRQGEQIVGVEKGPVKW